jgi:shikimate kinase
MTQSVNIIYLTGFMTSGKSTIGPILANVLGWEFEDLDHIIEREEGKTVVEIFESDGEKYFRDVEHSLLSEYSKRKKLILSLGGGTMAFERNIAIIKDTGKSVYLKSSPEMIYKRIKNKIDRPIFRDLVLSETAKPQDFIDRIDKYLSEREPFYNQADFKIDTDQTNIGITVDKLAKILSRVVNEES